MQPILVAQLQRPELAASRRARSSHAFALSRQLGSANRSFWLTLIQPHVAPRCSVSHPALWRAIFLEHAVVSVFAAMVTPSRTLAPKSGRQGLGVLVKGSLVVLWLPWVVGSANSCGSKVRRTLSVILCLCTHARANASGRVRLNRPPPQPQATKHKAQLVNLIDSLSFFPTLPRALLATRR